MAPEYFLLASLKKTDRLSMSWSKLNIFTLKDLRLALNGPALTFNAWPLPFERLTFETTSTTNEKEKRITLSILEIELRFLHSALHLIALYQCTKFHLFTFNTFVDMLRTKM